MPHITEVRALARGERFAVFVDDELLTHLDAAALARHGVIAGVEVTDAVCEALRLEGERIEAMRRAIRWLAARSRSRFEIDQRLKRLGIRPAARECTLTRLAELGYLDDRAFAESFVRTRRAGKPLGRSRLRYELRQKGVPDRLAEATLASACDDESELEAALRVVQSKRVDREDERALRRLIALLQRRGFAFEVIRRALQSEGLWHD